MNSTVHKKLITTLEEYHSLGIDEQVNHSKFYLYSLITHSTAIEGSTVTEIENQLLFDEGITSSKRSLMEQMMNLDLKAAYEKSIQMAANHVDFSINMLKDLSATVMKNTGSEYNTALGTFNAAHGDLRLVNVSAGFGGPSYLSYQKVPACLQVFCDWLNRQRHSIREDDIVAAYNLSFDAHYRLVTIHPWVDGNGRMSRLVMNHLQYEFGLVPVKITKDQKAEYIQALKDTREPEDESIFRRIMYSLHISNLQAEIAQYRKSMEGVFIGDKDSDVTDVTDRQNAILDLMRADALVSTSTIAERLEVTKRTVLRDVEVLKAKGLLRRVGSEKTGQWQVLIS